MRFLRLLNISRSRFRWYLVWPFGIGCIAWLLAWGSIDLIGILLYGLFFLLPANLRVYGINDLYDYETDKHNPKKQWYEALIEPSERTLFVRQLFIRVGIPICFLVIWTLVRWWSYIPLIWTAGYLLLSYLYSWPPLRAKAIPFLDGISNALYLIPWLVWRYLIVDIPINLYVCLAWWARVIAMHAYSAIPDIQADRQGGVATVATTLWEPRTQVYCIVLYLIAGLLSWLPSLFMVLCVAIYTGMVIASLRHWSMHIYRYFPLINMCVWAAICIYLLSQLI